MTTDKKKPRHTFVEFSLLESSTRMQVNEKTEEIRFIGADGTVAPVVPRFAQIVTLSDRGRIERVLARYPIGSRSKLFLNPLSELRGIRMFIAVDATPEMDAGNETGRWAIVWVRMQLSDDGGRVVIHSGDICDIIGAAADAEKVGWAIAVEWTMRQPDYQVGERVALVSDAHLGEHDAINAGSEYLPGFKLPGGFVLCYGKQKSPRDSIFQFGVSKADRIGRRYLENHPRPSADEYKNAVGHGLFDGYCFVDLNLEPTKR